ncbi:hypothetical protein ACFC1T_09385 [Kitasatospora sp. NPDC056076]|uniref:hypothetical protein n=1 Tax=Kitasatospora sp. NPDC056076 TaxID=3345703 RepID=UPI0035D6A899
MVKSNPPPASFLSLDLDDPQSIMRIRAMVAASLHEAASTLATLPVSAFLRDDNTRTIAITGHLSSALHHFTNSLRRGLGPTPLDDETADVFVRAGQAQLQAACEALADQPPPRRGPGRPRKNAPAPGRTGE